MIIWNSILEARRELLKENRRTAVTIGNFDGVHRGHQAIMRRTVELTREEGGLAVVLSFSNHSDDLLGERPFLLNNPALRKQLFERQGVDALLEVPFDRDFAAMEAETFFRQWLVEGLKIRSLVVGYDFRFGASGKGDYHLLRELADASGVHLERIPPVMEGDTIISSSVIRQLLAQGQIELANKMLGYPFTIDGPVVKGEQIGRRLGFPTANIRIEPQYLLPCYGVYLVRMIDGEKGFYGLANVGIKPTFGQYKPLVEVYLMDVEVNLYGHHVRIEFLRFIRPENRFSGPESLQRQINHDLETARKYLNQLTVDSSFSGCTVNGQGTRP